MAGIPDKTFPLVISSDTRVTCLTFVDDNVKRCLRQTGVRSCGDKNWWYGEKRMDGRRLRGADLREREAIWI
jgi:hypothetical protein